MNLQKIIRKVLREETKIPISLMRRLSFDDLEDLIKDINDLIDSGEDKTNAIYDSVRQFIAANQEFKFSEGGDEQSYWDSYVKVEKPLIRYIKSRLSNKL